MDKNKVASQISYSINNIVLDVVSTLKSELKELGAEECHEEIEKIKMVKKLLLEIDKSVKRQISLN